MKKIYLIGSIFFVVIIVFYIYIKISEISRINYIKNKVDIALSSSIHGFYPNCKVVDNLDKEYKYRTYSSSPDAEELNRYGFIKAKDLGEYNEITYCDVKSNIQIYSKDKSYDNKDCEAKYTFKLDCSKSFEEVFNKEQIEINNRINRALKQ